MIQNHKGSGYFSITRKQSAAGIFFLCLTIVTLLWFSSLTAQEKFPSHSLDSGLVAYYPFDGGASDHSGNGNHGFVHGARLISDRFGNPHSAYVFERASDYISEPGSSDFDFSDENALTVSYWMYTVNTERKANLTVDSRGGWTGSGCRGFWVTLSVNGSKITTAIHSSECNVSVDVLSQHRRNEWQMLTCTVDDDFLVLYHNGKLVNRRSLYETKWDTNPRPSLLIQPVDRIHYDWSTAVDDVRVYNRALNADEVRHLYEQGCVKQ